LGSPSSGEPFYFPAHAARSPHPAPRRRHPFADLRRAAGNRFLHYNVRNYVQSMPADETHKYATRAKPAAEINALISIIKDINPDILGVCEMGTPDRFDDFKKRLAEADLATRHSEYVQAADADRHLALVSRFPIIARSSQTDVPFEVNGQHEKVRRGFLDVTVEVNPDYQLRLVGVHLKSKLPIPEGEALIRRYEAQKLRAYVEKIMTANPKVNLVCYGDFNDTKNEPMFPRSAVLRGRPLTWPTSGRGTPSVIAGRTIGRRLMSIPHRLFIRQSGIVSRSRAETNPGFIVRKRTIGRPRAITVRSTTSIVPLNKK
jgi:endonuclease/exonuclease/phosphatase family metal-dependent hydrolase